MASPRGAWAYQQQAQPPPRPPPPGSPHLGDPSYPPSGAAQHSAYQGHSIHGHQSSYASSGPPSFGGPVATQHLAGSWHTGFPVPSNQPPSAPYSPYAHHQGGWPAHTHSGMMQPHYGMQPPGGVMQPHGGMAPPLGGSVPYSGGWDPAATYGPVHAPQHHQHPPMGYPPDLYHAHHLQQHQYHHSMAPSGPRAGTGLGSSPFLPPPASSGASCSIPLSAASGISLPREGSVGFSTASAAPTTYRHLFPSSQRPAQGFGGSRTMHAEDPRAAYRTRTSSACSSDPSPPLSSDGSRPTGSSGSLPSGTSGVQSANRKNDGRRSATGGDASPGGSRQPAGAREPSSGNIAQAGQKPSTRPKVSTGSKRSRTWDEHQKDLVVLAKSLTVKAEYHTLSNSHGARFRREVCSLPVQRLHVGHIP